jgi:GT2 family glycosyltransferase
MNWMRRIAIVQKLDCFGFQHNDGEPGPGTIDTLYAIAEARSEPWGVLFTNYDVCCVFNVEAVKAVGEWDWLRFPFYFLDNDYYRRLEEAGYPCVQTGLPCAHHNDASNTIKANETRRLVNSHFFPVCEQLYKVKWNE